MNKTKEEILKDFRTFSSDKHLESFLSSTLDKMREETLKFTQAEKNQLMSYVQARDEGVDRGWYYGNREQFEKRHKSILSRLKSGGKK